ncbi:hypothetical protein [Pseudokineococcus marinus]
MAAETPSFCDLPGVAWTPRCRIADGAETVSQVIDAASDPLGYLADSLQAAAAGLAGVVLPALESLTHPDLSAEWFVSAYAVSWALSIFVFVVFLGWNFLGLSRRRVSGDDVIETVTFYTPLFLGGALLGPLLGNMVLGLTGALTDSIIRWGIAGSVEETTGALNDAIAAGNSAQMVGGAAVAIILFMCLILALLLVFVVLLVMLVTLYLTGVLIPLSLVWLVHPRQRSKGLKILMVWLGICFSHVLLFLLLGVAFRMVGNLATEWDEPGMVILTNLAVAVIALLLATLSPVALLKFAPIGPGGVSTAGPSLSVPGGSSASAGPSYPESSSDSQLGQMSRDTDGGADASADTDSTSTSATGGLAGRLDDQKASTSSMEASGSGGGGAAGEAAGAGAGAGAAAGEAGGAASSAGSTAASGASAAAPGVGVAAAAANSDVEAGPGGAGGKGPDPIGAPATAGGDAAETADTGAPGESSGSATAGLAEAGGQTQETGDKVTSAGSLAMASGAGAPVGVGLMAAGQGMKAAGAAVSKTAQAAQSAGDLAGEQMDHGADDSAADGKE